ncbi:hypothetical protein AC578_4711 [Pseudocercospora eumusae]|uniref:DUF1772 domain-containing protein n=1 Tax=Pseudocercospora eumusae TaxID=321146 RepID=A0A139GZ91_9PEZI|nr:hypothetical protein AC578_4711 [Pseudocercospora eumusae]
MASSSFTHHALWLAPATSIFLAGYSFATSQNTTSQIADLPPQQSTPIFKRITESSFYTVLPTLLVSSAASAILWQHSKSEQIKRLHLIAAFSTFAAIPYSGLVMWGSVKRLVQISEDSELQLKAEQNLEARQLLRKWTRLSYINTMLYVVGAVAGTRAAMLL